MINLQRVELTEHYIYMRLAERSRDQNNADVLRRIGQQEKVHAAYWQKKTGVEVKPNSWIINKRIFLATILGPTFVLKQMEKREGTGSKNYDRLCSIYPETAQFA